MTAETFTAKRNEDSRYYGCVRFVRGDDRAVDSTAAAALAAVTVANSVSDVLDILEAQYIRQDVHAEDQTGAATSVLT